MRNLLKCEFTRLTRSVFFWIITGFCVLWPIITALFYHGILAFTFTATGIGFEDVELPKEMLRYLTWMISISFINELPKFSALFACIHIGREYTDGIVRNKIIAITIERIRGSARLRKIVARTINISASVRNTTIPTPNLKNISPPLTSTPRPEIQRPKIDAPM